MISASEMKELQRNKELTEFIYWDEEVISNKLREISFNSRDNTTPITIYKRWHDIAFDKIIQMIINELERKGYDVEFIENDIGYGYVTIQISW